MTTTTMRPTATRPTPADLERLADIRSPWSVSIYAPAWEWFRDEHPTLAASAAIRGIAHELAATGAPAETVELIRTRLERMAAPTGAVSRGRVTADDGAALFVGPETEEAYLLRPAPREGHVIADRFRIAPLLPTALATVPPIHVLAASEHRVRLVDVLALPARLVDVPGLPRDLESEIRLDLTGDRDTLAHLRTSEDPKERLEQFARAIHRACEPVLRARGGTLLIAAAEPLAGILAATASRGTQLAGVVHGNRDDDDPQQLADAVDAQRARERLTEFRRLTEAPDARVIHDPHVVRIVTRDGAADTLFLAEHWLMADGAVPAADGEFTDPENLIRSALAHATRLVCVRDDDPVVIDRSAAILRFPRSS